MPAGSDMGPRAVADGALPRGRQYGMAGPGAGQKPRIQGERHLAGEWGAVKEFPISAA
ncbi:hypothetical protein GCM10009636_16400 [Arthrobacter koreensis]